MMKFRIFIFCFLVNLTCLGQIGIGTTTPEPSSILDVDSDSKGFLLPRMYKEDILSISNPASGLMVFVLDDTVHYFYINGFCFPVLYGRLWIFDGYFWRRFSYLNEPVFK